jgi:hypothetical protein
MRRPQTVFFAILVAVATVFAQFCARARSDDGDGDESIDTTRYQATVQEGLGASVAILLDNSGSMDDTPDSGGDELKATIAKRVLGQVLAQTDSFVAKQSGFPVNIGLYVFSDRVQTPLPMGPYNREALTSALAAIPKPDGATAIGDAMEAAITDLYAAGTFRKYLLVVTDGENTDGRNPRTVAREIARRSDGAVRLFLVAFDVDKEKFGFVPEVRGTLVEARDAIGLGAQLDTLYRGKILAEAVDAGETFAQPGTKDSAASAAPVVAPPTGAKKAYQ